ncbi:ATP-binding protein [Streptomyces hokutonensis]|uniref:ATP-binding protein n=1 Tax=Streptomyces hokutonensis TaxID=1306990 RepID=UPI00037A9C1F|nr:ATP-binding protein [Streptomyces hokutonensis]
MSPHTTPSPQLLDVASPDLAHWLELPAHRSGVRVARHVMGAQLARWGLPESVRDDAVLLVSELATNGVCHTPSARLLCGVGIVDDRCLRIEVHDHDYTGGGLSRCEPCVDDESGRGLFIVQALADTWGVDRSALTGGKAVWAMLPTGR